jgi:hypothetical protein
LNSGNFLPGGHLALLALRNFDHIQILSGALGKKLRGIIAQEQNHLLDLVDETPAATF